MVPPAPRSRPKRWLAVGAAALVVGAAALVASLSGGNAEDPPAHTERLAGSDVLDVPPISETSAVFLADGHPVFVVHHPDDTVSVVDAFSAHTVFGVRKLVGWCASSRTFDDVFHDAAYNAYGRYLAGPAESGLIRFENDEVDGLPRSVRVGGKLAFLPTELRPRPGFQGPGCDGTTHPWLFHRFAQSVIWRSPADAVAEAPGGWIALHALFVVRDGLPARLCEALEEETCIEGAVVRGIDVEGIVRELTDVTQDALWLARVEDGRITALTRVPVTQ